MVERLLGTTGVVLMLAGPVLAGATGAAAATFTLTQTLVDALPAAGDGFGAAVALDANRALVGIPGDSTFGSDRGAATLFDTATGAILQSYANPLGAAGDEARFGAAVALEGSTVLIGAPDQDIAGDNAAGQAYQFSTASPAPQRTLTNPAISPNERFGQAVAIDGSRLYVALPGDDTNSPSTGPAGGQVIEYDTGFLAPQRVLEGNTQVNFRGFGGSLAADGGRLAVGEVPPTFGIFLEEADAYVFGSSGTLPQRVIDDPAPAPTGQIPERTNRFGVSIALDGNRLLIGDDLDDTSGPRDSGRATLFDAVTGALLTSFESPTPDQNGFFGRAVAISGDTVAIGEPGHDAPNGDAGRVLVFDAVSGALVQEITSPGQGSARFGAALALWGDTLLVGAPGDDLLGANAGRAFVYTLTPEPAPHTPIPLPGAAVFYLGALVVVGLVRRRG